MNDEGVSQPIAPNADNGSTNQKPAQGKGKPGNDRKQ
jgi:hypothetical protein